MGPHFVASLEACQGQAAVSLMPATMDGHCRGNPGCPRSREGEEGSRREGQGKIEGCGCFVKEGRQAKGLGPCEETSAQVAGE